MSRSKKIFKEVQKSLPDTLLCGDLLVVARPHLLLKAFLLEPSSGRNKVYLWRVVAPLFRPMHTIILSYSDRVPAGQIIDLCPDDPAVSASAIAQVISDGHLSYLRNMRSFSNVCASGAWDIEGRSRMTQFDIAMVCYLTGADEKFRRIIAKLTTELGNFSEREMIVLGPAVHAAAAGIEKGDLPDLIESWERQNIEKFKLSPALKFFDP